jgi:hypothetical protein
VITERNEVRWLSELADKPGSPSSKVGTNSPTFVLEPIEQ